MARETVETRLFIGNEFVTGKARKTFQLTNPATEEPTFLVHEAGREDIDLAVAYAKKAQPAWAKLDSFKRAQALNAFAEILTKPENAERFAYLDAICMGGPVAHYPIQVSYSGLLLNFCAGVAMDLRGETSLGSADHLSIVLKQPYGVTAAIVPWNAPLLMSITVLSSCLAAGNAMILKTSEKAPLSCIFLAQLIKESGIFPPGLIQIIAGPGPTTGTYLAEHMEIRKLSFAGSIATGRKVKEAAARSNLKNVTLELGGKSPLIVFEDANLQKAATEAAVSIGMLSGQTCVALSRVYVQESIHAEFVEAYKAAIQAMLSKPGDPLDATTSQGPQADILQHKRVMEFLDRAKDDGLKPIIGGGRYGSKGFFIEPTIFAPDKHDLLQDEIFGPVSVVQSFTDEEEVLARANDSEFGLYASVFTKDIGKALRFATRIEAGSLGINCTSMIDTLGMSMGGWKQSGDGREWGRAGVESWLETKTVVINLKD